MALPHGHARESHAHEQHAVAPVMASETASVREPFGLAQIVSLIAGILFVVLGAIGLARSGFGTLIEPTAEIGEMGATPLLSLIHLAIGVGCLAGATGRGAARGTCMFVGPLLIAAGIIALIEQIEALGYTEVNGMVYLITGIVTIVAAMLTPLVAVEDRRYSAM